MVFTSSLIPLFFQMWKLSGMAVITRQLGAEQRLEQVHLRCHIMSTLPHGLEKNTDIFLIDSLAALGGAGIFFSPLKQLFLKHITLQFSCPHGL